MKLQTVPRWASLALGLVGRVGDVAAAFADPPEVSNVVASQRPGTGWVDVYYNVSADADSVVPRLICSSDNGTTFDLLPVSVTGDINRFVAPGINKHIEWDAYKDYPGQQWPEVVAKVYAFDGPVLGGEMVFVPAGTFTMGSNSGSVDQQPEHPVYLDAFYIDKYEVTNAEYQRFMDAGGYSARAFWSTDGWAWKGSRTEPDSWSTGEGHTGPAWPDFPIAYLSYYEAEAYANFVGKRLPTEAEWEKAARSTDLRTYPWGEGIDETRANYANSADPYEPLSTPVGFYDERLHPSPPFQTTDSPGPYGAYDQAGNAWEWCRDWYGPYQASSPPNPMGPATGTYRVRRGRNYSGPSWLLTCTARDSCIPTFGCAGVRCVRAAP